MADVALSLNWRVFTLAKAGNRSEEFEDAYAADPVTGRFAIADGASESSFAGAWAEMLVKGFVENPGSWSGWLPAARTAWQQKFQGNASSWYVEEKVREGAFATFLGVTFGGPGLGWKAVAVGDCCLFHVRAGRLLRSFPLKDADAFGNQPELIGSQPTTKLTRRLRSEGDWQEADLLLLMTDALAQWFLRNATDNAESWKEIPMLETQETFDAWATKCRRDKVMRNDDLTLMVIGTNANAQVFG